MTKEVHVPDVGDATEIEVIEVLVAVGDTIKPEDSLVVLESDKASMEIPSPHGGKVASIAVSVGDQVDEGDLILELETDDEDGAEGESDAPDDTASGEDASSDAEDAEHADSEETGSGDADEAAPEQEEKSDRKSEDKSEAKSEAKASPDAGDERREETVTVPDVGDADEITVTEILVKVGDELSKDDSIVVLESDKASMEIPSPHDGTVTEILVAEGDEVAQGDPVLKMEIAAAASDKDASGKKEAPKDTTAEDEKAGEAAKEKEKEANSGTSGREDKPTASQPTASQPTTSQPTASTGASDGRKEKSGKDVHAGPAVRKQAREYGVDLAAVDGSGRKGRVLKEDVQEYVKARLSGEGSGAGIPEMPSVDFSKFGETSLEPLSRVRRSGATNLHRSWLNVPHVTQFDEADITELEAFRRQQSTELEREGKKLTPLAFLVKACAFTLKQFPHFNASLDAGIENYIIKHYYHIGIAVDTDDGLVVPVLRDADKKGVIEIAEESGDLADKARNKKLPLDAMQGSTFTISSLGGIGGTAFTPIVNAPEVAILGVSRSKVAPVYDGEAFAPRTMLPLSLSYDHRAIDGAEAARFITHLSSVLSDVRRLIL